MKQKTSKIFFIIFVIVSLADWLMAYIVSLKHPLYNEMNIIYLLTGNLWLGLLVKFAYLTLVYFVLFKWYKGYREIMRYAFVYVICIALVVQFVGLMSGIREYNRDPSTLVPIPKEVLIEENVKLSKQIGIPFTTYMIIFIIFTLVEKERGYKKLEE